MERILKLCFILMIFCSLAFAWDDNNYAYRRPFNVTSATLNSTNYTVQLVLNSTNFNYSRAQSNLYDFAIYCDSVRDYVFNASINTSSNSYFYFRPPYTQNPQCYYYYGNTTISPQFNGQGAFPIYFEDFNGTTFSSLGYRNASSSNWTLTGNSTLNVSVTSGGQNNITRDNGVYVANYSNTTTLMRARQTSIGLGGYLGLTINFNLLDNFAGVNKYFKVDTNQNTFRMCDGDCGLLTSAVFTDTVGQYYVYTLGSHYQQQANIAFLNASVLEAGVSISTNYSFFSKSNGTIGLDCSATSGCEYDWIAVMANNVTTPPASYNFGLEEPSAFSATSIFQATDYETNSTNLTLMITNISAISVSDVILNWNGTNYTATGGVTGNSSIFVFNVTNVIPLLDYNSSVGVQWFFNITSGSATTPSSTLNQTQVLAIAYNISSLSVNPSTPLQGQFINATDELTIVSGLPNVTTNQVLLRATVSFNTNTSNSMGFVSPTEFQNTTLIAPAVSRSFVLNSTLTITFNGVTKTRQSGNVVITVSGVVLYSTCNGTYPVALNFTFQNEEIPTQQVNNASMNATFTVWDLNRNVNVNFTFSFNGVSSAAVCIAPASANVSIDSFQVYSGTVINQTYYQRAFFLYNATVSNVTTTIALYMANATVNKLIQYLVTSNVNLPLSDYFVSAYRYYPNLNQYLLVSMALTDSFGTANTYLTPNDVWFRFVLFSKVSGNTSIFAPQQIQCDPLASFCTVNLQETGGLGTYFDQAGKITVSCYVDTTVTNTTTCTVVDVSQTLTSFTLTEYRVGNIQSTTLCSNTVNSGSGSAVCSFNGSGLITYTLVGNHGEYLASGSFTLGGNSALFGTGGLFATFLLFISLAFLTIYSPSASIFFGSLALMFAKLLGFFIADVTLLAGVIVMSIIIGWRLRA